MSGGRSVLETRTPARGEIVGSNPILRSPTSPQGQVGRTNASVEFTRQVRPQGEPHNPRGFWGYLTLHRGRWSLFRNSDCESFRGRSARPRVYPPPVDSPRPPLPEQAREVLRNLKSQIWEPYPSGTDTPSPCGVHECPARDCLCCDFRNFSQPRGEV